MKKAITIILVFISTLSFGQTDSFEYFKAIEERYKSIPGYRVCAIFLDGYVIMSADNDRYAYYEIWGDHGKLYYVESCFKFIGRTERKLVSKRTGLLVKSIPPNPRF